MKIPEILKTLRIERGLTQKELAERLKIGQATIACYEKGSREPHIQNLIAYANFFECTIDYLVGRTDDFGNIVIDVEDMLNWQYSNEERTILEKIRHLGHNEKMRVMGYLDSLISH